MSDIIELTKEFRKFSRFKLGELWKRMIGGKPVSEPKPGPVEEWFKDCHRWHGRVLISGFRHWCPDWDFLPIDTSVDEFGACTCEYPEIHGFDWVHVKSGKRYRLIEHRLVVLEATLTELVLYQRAEGTGPIWARPAKEFFDGRFKKVEA